MQLDLTRDTVNSIAPRLKHNKNADTTRTVRRNAITRSIEKAYEHYNSGELKPVLPVKAITDKQELINYMEKIREKGIYVLDLETTGVDIWNDIIVGVALYVEGEQPAYVPINHTNLNLVIHKGQLEEKEVKEVLKPYLIDKEIKVIAHNGKFDDKILFTNWGYRIGNLYWDSMIAQHILNENEPKGLKHLYSRYIDKSDEGYDYGELFGRNTPFNFIPLDLATLYGANDGIKTWQLYKFQSQWLNPNHKRKDFRELYKVFTEIEMKLLPVVTDIELRGIELRIDYYKQIEQELTKKLTNTENSMDKIVVKSSSKILQNEELSRLTKNTGKINYNSPKQVQILLYDIWNLPAVDRRNPRGTGEDIMKTLLDKTKDSNIKEFIAMFLEFKGDRKILTTYITKLPKEVEKKTNAIHTQFNQVGTVTGRFSSTNPNLQNIPSRGEWGGRVRQGFKAREGCIFIGSDLSQIEPRVLASLVNSFNGGKDMFNAYLEGRDLYVMMASKIYQLPEEECMEFDSEGNFQEEGNFRRDSVKSVLLGIMYERGNNAIAEQFNKPIKWADEIIQMFNKSFPHVEQYRKYLVHHAETLGYVTTLQGRKRRLPDMKLRNPKNNKYNAAHRQVLNAVIQGTAGDILKQAMINVGKNKRLKELDAHMVLTIHDELILEAPEEYKEEVGEILAEEMKSVGYNLLGIPMKCDVEYMKVWGGE